MNITTQLLRDRGACESQIYTFATFFGEGPAPLDDETAIRYAAVFNWDWAAQHLLPAAVAAEQTAFDKISKATGETSHDNPITYQQATNPALVALAKTSTAAWDVHKATIAAAFVKLARETNDGSPYLYGNGRRKL